MNTEPVRRSLYVAAAIVALSTLFGALAVVDEITTQVAFGGLSAGLAQFAVIAFGAELARSKAYAPATVAQIETTHERQVAEVMDAESVIARAETGGGVPTDEDRPRP